MGNSGSSEDASSGSAAPAAAQQPKSAGKPRNMSLAQLARFNGVGEKNHTYIGLRGEIFDVTADSAELKAKYESWFGKNKAEATDEELETFRSKYTKLGNLIEQRVVTMEELSRCNGENGTPIYIAARGLVFDVSEGASFYGPGGGYHLFAGHNAQRALAKMSLNVDDVKNSSLEDLEPKDLKILDDWISKYYEKYPLIGTLQEEGSTTEVQAVEPPQVPEPETA